MSSNEVLKIIKDKHKDLNVVRLKNVNKLSYMVSKFYNTARFIQT